jgi:organic hydroperoxide reductase OsmC/OhrA
MSEHRATIQWSRNSQQFTDNRYSRAHKWEFDGGASIRASSAPSSVAVPMSDPTGVDPEEALVAAISSCHMLWFLSLAARRGFVVESYSDDAVGFLHLGDDGKTRITEVRLSPRVRVSSAAFSEAELSSLHHEAHENCTIANSVSATIHCNPLLEAD